MNNLQEQLYDKMQSEQSLFCSRLLSMSAEEVMDNAYEYAIREDIMIALEHNDLTRVQVQALLQTATPLADIYAQWSKMEAAYMDSIQEAIEARAGEAIEEQHRRHRERGDDSADKAASRGAPTL